jgi:serine/threonine-protein kinase ATR
MMSPSSRDLSNGLRSSEPGYGVHDVPPSTMAAQLISNLTTINKPVRQVEQDDLQRLMAEVSTLENSATEAVDIDIDVQLDHKHKLIYVFARAVLERLSKDDPFMNVPQLTSQAADALDIFMSAIKETPDVLNYVLGPGNYLQQRGHEPLWIWLFPRILKLLHRSHCEKLTEKIKDFFYVSFQAVSRFPRLWNLSSLFYNYLKQQLIVNTWIRKKCL